MLHITGILAARGACEYSEIPVSICGQPQFCAGQVPIARGLDSCLYETAGSMASGLDILFLAEIAVLHNLFHNPG